MQLYVRCYDNQAAASDEQCGAIRGSLSFLDRRDHYQLVVAVLVALRQE